MLSQHILIFLSAVVTAAGTTLVKIPFTNRQDSHLSPDVDGPWPTIPLSYSVSDSQNASLNAYITFSNASLLVRPQTCADDVTNNTFRCGEFIYPEFYLGGQNGSPLTINFNSDQWSVSGVIPSNNTGLDFSEFLFISGNITGQNFTSNIGGVNIETPAIVAENLTTVLSNTSRPIPLLNSMISLPAFAASLSESGMTASEFFSFHTGSVNPVVNGTLIAGGYDNNRILGDLMNWNTTYNDLGVANRFLVISHIKIPGVESGFLPLETFKEVNGSFPQGPHEREPLISLDDYSYYDEQVIIEPGSPYLHLSRHVCQPLADSLELTYDETRNLYLWSYPANHPIFRSPVYLELTLAWDTGGNLQKWDSYPAISVKIPMTLLQHTFNATTRAMNGSLIPPARYFPCSPTDFEANHHLPPRLGRPFLQAAFIASIFNYTDGEDTTAQNWIAQAPGPTTIEKNVEDLVEVESGFISSRVNVALGPNAWTEIDSDGVTTLDQLNAVPKGGDGAKEMGIKVGVPISGTILAGVLLFFSAKGIMKSRATRKQIEREIAEEDATAREIERVMSSEKELQPMSRGSADEQRSMRRESTTSSLSEDHIRAPSFEEVSLLETGEDPSHVG
ncbi:hypothetical protein F4804DRAFT_349285 [Jackrogersella minutella]|nr:hypothetical protein F4804DRAFT_349285 [Jackrogersella minutella]